MGIMQLADCSVTFGPRAYHKPGKGTKSNWPKDFGIDGGRPSRFNTRPLVRYAMKPAALDLNFGNAVIDGRAEDAAWPLRGWLLVGLVCACLVPRIWMAWRLDTLCNDGVFYIHLAEALQRGDLDAGLGQLRLNTYPPVLASLHALGLDWQAAGEMWGVALSSLTVLPLFGWLRRQFNDRLATVGCLLYAVHPKLVESSPELLRDPTFWLLWALSLYASWRAAAQQRLRWYLPAGLCIALAIHTRFEGWTLYLPLMGWTVCRPIARRAGAGHEGRGYRAAGGCAAAVAVCPLLLLAINVTWLAGQPHWEWGNFRRLEYVALWSRATWNALQGEDENRAEQNRVEPAPTASSQLVASPAMNVSPSPEPVVSEPPLRMSVARTLWLYVNALRRGFGALLGISWMLGFLCCPRVWLRRDHLILFLVSGCVAAGAWVHLWYAQATSSRYFLSIVMLALPCAATGCCWVCRWLERAANGSLAASPDARRQSLLSQSEHRPYGWARAMAVFGAISLTLTANATEVLVGQHPGRGREAALGRWILAEFGPGRQISTPTPLGLLGFYAQATTHALNAEATALDSADLAVALPHQTTPHETKRFAELARSRGLRPIDRRRLPPGFDWRDAVVLARDTQASQCPVAGVEPKRCPGSCQPGHRQTSAAATDGDASQSTRGNRF